MSLVIATHRLGSPIGSYAQWMKSETAENVKLGAAGAAVVLMGFLVAARVAQREIPHAQEHITIMKVRPVPIALGSPRYLRLIFE
jgi:hypothetical protein